MCGLSLSKIFGDTSPDNLPSQSSEKHLFAGQSTTNRNPDEDDWSLPPAQIPRYNSAPTAHLPSGYDIARSNTAKKQPGLKKKGTNASLSSYTSNPAPHAITSPKPIHSYAFTSPLQSAPSAREAQWISGATAYVKEYMRVFDSSHDFAHVQRVLQHAMHILDAETRLNPSTRFDPTIVVLSALLHDVGDKKYTQKAALAAALHSRPKRLAFADEEPTSSSSDDILSPRQHHLRHQTSTSSHRNHSRPTLHDPQLTSLLSLSHSDPETLVKRILLYLGAPQELARTVQKIVKNVSYSHEILDPAHVRGVILRHPELAIVQDADRLDALGAIGIGRCFTYGGAQSSGELVAKLGGRSGSSLAGSRLSSLTAQGGGGGAVTATAGGTGGTGGTAAAISAILGDGKGRGLQESVDHFEDKLCKLEGIMKTKEGKRMARVRTERLRVFRGWWEEEMAEVGVGIGAIGSGGGGGGGGGEMDGI